MSTEHSLDASRIHHDWDGVASLHFVFVRTTSSTSSLPMAGERQVFETSTVDEVVWDFDTIYNLAA